MRSTSARSPTIAFVAKQSPGPVEAGHPQVARALAASDVRPPPKALVRDGHAFHAAQEDCTAFETQSRWRRQRLGS